MIADVGPARGGASIPEPATVTSLRARNRAVVLKQIILAGQTTRATIARECGLSVASATNLVVELIGEGLVVEAGSVSSRGGRPITLIEPRPDGAYLVGADVGERGVAVELFDLGMTRVDREFRGGRELESPETIAHDLDDALSALRKRNPAAWESVVGVGLGLPGIVETEADGRQVLYGQSLDWPPIPIAELISHDVAVYADNGAKAQAKAELWFGGARGVEHALVVLLGRGVGLGVVAGGELQYGSTSSAGEWGHVKIERGGRLCRCGGRGCIEAYVGADAILSAWSEAGGRYDGTGWRALGGLIESAESGDPAASSVVEDVIQTLGAGLGSLVNLENPQRIVIGGWVGLRLMESLTDRLDAAIRKNALARPGSQFELLASTFGGDTVALGAAIMPLETLLKAPRSA